MFNENTSVTKIPKIIHYCWFGGNKPRKVVNLINEWKKKLYDYDIVEWNERNFNINESCEFVKEAFKCRKWAFVSDYVRLYVLYNYGGIYLDTDVQLLKNFNDYLNEDMFISQESDKSLCTAVIGAKKYNDFIKEFLDTYENKKFLINGGINSVPNSELIKKCLENKYGDIFFDNEYKFDIVHIYPQTYFCGKNIHNYKLLVSDNTVSIHNLDATWYSPWHKFMRSCKKIVMKIIHFFK